MIQVIGNICSLCGRLESEVKSLMWAIGVGYVCPDCEKIVPKEVNSKNEICEVKDTTG